MKHLKSITFLAFSASVMALQARGAPEIVMSDFERLLTGVYFVQISGSVDSSLQTL